MFNLLWGGIIALGPGERGRDERLGIRGERCRRRDEVCGRRGVGGGVRKQR